MSGVSRRGLLGATGAGVAGAAIGAGATYGATREPDASGAASPAAPAEDPPPPRRHYRSTMATAPEVEIETSGDAALASGLIFFGPRVTVFEGAVLRDDGEPVWLLGDGQAALDLRVQTYRGKPHLTYWTGLALTGVGRGYGVILDQTYTEVARVHAGNGSISDLHEFRLTDRGTALLSIYRPRPADLTAIDGPTDGWIWDNHVQEVDVESGEVLLDWVMSDHVDIAETYQELEDDGTSADAPFDVFHVNSVEARDDVLLISARHTHALYAFDRRSGEMLWRLGGKKSDFEVAEDAAFSWQHDARWRDDGIVTIFDNHGDIGMEDTASKGMALRVDEEAMTVELVQTYDKGDRFAGAMGNTQVLENGNVLVGWGTARGVSEYTAEGELLYDLTFDGFGSYRAYRHEWTGRPASDPDIAVVAGEAAPTAYVSWNGATELASWRVLAGADDGSLTEMGATESSGFETEIPLESGVATVRVEALDSAGTVLGRSRAVAL